MSDHANRLSLPEDKDLTTVTEAPARVILQGYAVLEPVHYG